MKEVNALERDVYSLFKMENLNSCYQPDEINDLIDNESEKSLNNCRFAQSPEETEKLIIKIFKNNNNLLKMESLNSIKVMNVLSLLFDKVVKFKENEKYFDALINAIIKNNNNKNIHFPTSLFNFLFLYNIPETTFYKKNTHNKEELTTIWSNIDKWANLAKTLKYDNKIPQNYSLYCSSKFQPIAFYNYLAMLSFKHKQIEFYKDIFNVEMGDCLFNAELERYLTPNRVRQIKLELIPLYIFSDNIGKEGLNEFYFNVKDGSVFKTKLDQIRKNIIGK